MAQARRQLPAAAAVCRFAATVLARIVGRGALFPLRQFHAQLETAHIALHEGAGAPHFIAVQVFRTGRQQGQERRLGRRIAGVLIQLVGAETEAALAQLPFRAAVEAALVKHAAIAVIAVAQSVDGHIERHAALVARQGAAHAVLAALRQFGGQVAMRDAGRAGIGAFLRPRRHDQGAQQQGARGDGQGGRGRHHGGKLGALPGRARTVVRRMAKANHYTHGARRRNSRQGCQHNLLLICNFYRYIQERPAILGVADCI
ncbi:hypothetical protein D3C87_785550 [compost metagenome]